MINHPLKPSTRILLALSWGSSIAIATFEKPWPTVVLLGLFALLMSIAFPNDRSSE